MKSREEEDKEEMGDTGVGVEDTKGEGIKIGIKVASQGLREGREEDGGDDTSIELRLDKEGKIDS